MRPSFDLLTRPWIPVLRLSGDVAEVGLFEALAQAHRLREISDASPLVSVALHRLLLAMLHRVFGPADEAAWDRLWRAGALDAAALTAYLTAVADRFDLFDPAHPFGQEADLPEALAGPVCRLAPEQASGSQATVWDHHTDGAPAAVRPAQAARWLLSHQAFCLSGRCGDGQGLQAVAAGPLAHTAVFMPRGDTLLQTLLLNLIPYHPAADEPLPCAGRDLPAWEREAAPAPDAAPTGYLDVLTWQPRRLRLVSDNSGGETVVRAAVVMPGRHFGLRRLACDPMVAYRADRPTPASAGPATSWSPLRLGEGGSPWRLTARVVRPSHARWRRPLVLEHASRRIARGVVPAGTALRLCLMGLSGDKARVDLWRRECCALPLACLHDPQQLADFELALSAAERTHAVVGEHLRRFAAGRLAPSSGDGFWLGLRDALVLLSQRLDGSLEERGSALDWWAGTCRHEAFRAWESGVRRHACRGGDWRRRAELHDDLAGALRRTLQATLGVG